MKRLTYEFVKEQFEKEGYELLSREYVNSKQKLKYRCPKGHEHSISWHCWRRGQRCFYCYGNAKLTIEFIKSEFEKEGYILLTTKYKNAHQKLEYICSSGHKHDITWGHWQSGKRCPYCAGQGKPTIEFIRSEFEKEGCALLSEKYINSRSHLHYTCAKGHKCSIVWDSWKQGCRCYTCEYLKRSGSGHHNWKGGISCEPYCDAWLDKEFKESIKERDNYQCQNPDCWETSKILTIHHIDYNKKNCRPENLITLCNSCNSRANFNRSWHKLFYKIVMEKRNKIKKFVAGL